MGRRTIRDGLRRLLLLERRMRMPGLRGWVDSLFISYARATGLARWTSRRRKGDTGEIALVKGKDLLPSMMGSSNALIAKRGLYISRNLKHGKL